MKTLKQFFIWLFADFAYSLYEMAGEKFALKTIGVTARRKSDWITGIKPYIFTQHTGDNIPPLVNAYGINYHFAGTFGSYNVYVLPGLPQSQINTIGKYAANLTSGSNVAKTTSVKGSKSNSSEKVFE